MKKTVFAALVGRANTGKSTLLNRLVGDKVAAVSDKPQTTRTQIRGMITKDEIQYVFTDTPGLHQRHGRLSEHMLKNTRAAMAGGDVIIMLADANKHIGKPEKNLIASFGDKMPVVLVLNKADLAENKNEILPLITKYGELYPFADIVPMSAMAGDNTSAVFGVLDKYAVDCGDEFPYNPELSTDQSEKFYLSEMLREKLLRALSDEIPHGIAVAVENIEDSQTNKGEPIVDIQFLVICERAGHKGIIIGKQGEMLKFIGEKARKEFEAYFESKVNMKMWVKVVEDWRDKERCISEYGLNFLE
jgi:GTP-binding protein Era